MNDDSTIAMELSCVVIGRNASATIRECIESVAQAAILCKSIASCEIIYVDSASTDESVSIVSGLKLPEPTTTRIVRITDGFTTAALGRHVGLQYCSHDHILFLDSDMILRPGWFQLSIPTYLAHGAVTADRDEVLTSARPPITRPRFYGINAMGPVRRFGGFVMVSRDVLAQGDYSPQIPDEEEADLYAKFVGKSRVWALPEVAFAHLNSKTARDQLVSYIRPFARIGYLYGLFRSVRYGYFSGYLKVQSRYLIDIATVLLVPAAVLCPLLSCLPLIVFAAGFLVDRRVTWKGRLATVVLFPYKLVCTVFYLLSRRSASVNDGERSYSLSFGRMDW